MASENVEDWDQPLPAPMESAGETEDISTLHERRQIENLEKLKKYVELHAYQPVQPPLASAYTEKLAKPRPRTIVDNSKEFSEFLVPEERAERLKRLAAKYTTITTELQPTCINSFKGSGFLGYNFVLSPQRRKNWMDAAFLLKKLCWRQLEQEIRAQKTKDSKKEDILKRKQHVYYEMLTKLERQCRTQYLNVLMKKFASFIAQIATTMPIPPALVDPYARMQSGIFCNILLAIGIQPTSQAAIYYNTKEGSEYMVYHRLSHALLSIIIKALDSASTRNPQDEKPIEVNFDMDNYIKDRLMYAAEKKILQKGTPNPDEDEVKSPDLDLFLKNCDHRNYKPCKQ